MNKELLALQKKLREDGVLISFAGKFSQEIIQELGEAVKKYLETEDQPKNYIYNIFSIFIEQTQNIKNYCVSKSAIENYEQIANSCIVVIGNTANSKYICSGNLILNKDVEILESTLNEVVNLNKEELKKIYKQKLKQEMPPGSTSAGMGFIDIARKANAPLEYSIVKVNQVFSFFTLKAVV